ncbi:MAG: glycosyltransferase [Pseudomonadota bacterium]
MTQPAVSVVVVSRDRPEALKRCVLGLSQLRYPRFEVVIVADPAGLMAVRGMACAEHLKLVEFDRPNISEARNAGISEAAGDIVAFVDDDAVPEPSWLQYLVAPFAKDHVAAAGGFVRGRNGISYQWRARSVDRQGRAVPLEVNPQRVTILAPRGQRATKTEGTNMAVRRDVLVDLEGFDPGFSFFLDETDLNLRLMQAGLSTAIVPQAEVHHGFAASLRRRHDRVPRDLFDIGSSWAVFQRKYIRESARADHWRTLRQTERARALGHMVAGRLQPRDVRHLLRRLDQGYTQGMSRKRGGGQVSRRSASAFKPFPVSGGQSIVLSGRIHQRAALRSEAVEQVRAGHIVTLILLSPTALYHRVRFAPHGYWEQTGGMFGRSERDAPLFRLQSFSMRVERESRRVAKQRLIDAQ